MAVLEACAGREFSNPKIIFRVYSHPDQNLKHEPVERLTIIEK